MSHDLSPNGEKIDSRWRTKRQTPERCRISCFEAHDSQGRNYDVLDNVLEHMLAKDIWLFHRTYQLRYHLRLRDCDAFTAADREILCLIIDHTLIHGFAKFLIFRRERLQVRLSVDLNENPVILSSLNFPVFPVNILCFSSGSYTFSNSDSADNVSFIKVFSSTVSQCG